MEGNSKQFSQNQVSKKIEGDLVCSFYLEKNLYKDMKDHANVYHEKSFYFFGGRNSQDSILRLDEVSLIWSLVGQLNNGRYSHKLVYHVY